MDFSFIVTMSGLCKIQLLHLLYIKVNCVLIHRMFPYYYQHEHIVSFTEWCKHLVALSCFLPAQVVSLAPEFRSRSAGPSFLQYQSQLQWKKTCPACIIIPCCTLEEVTHSSIDSFTENFMYWVLL